MQKPLKIPHTKQVKIDEFNKIVGINLTHKNLLHFYILTMKNTHKKVGKQFHFKQYKIIKYLGINLTRGERLIY